MSGRRNPRCDYLVELCIKRREPGFARDSMERRTLQASVSHWDGDPLPLEKASFDDCVAMIEDMGVKVEFAKCVLVWERRAWSAVDSRGEVRTDRTDEVMEVQGEIRVAPADMLDFEYQGNVREEDPDGLLVRWTLRVPMRNPLDKSSGMC